MSDFTEEIKGHTLEFMDDTHTYLCDGIILPSITQILKHKFSRKYEGVGTGVLKRASEAGTAMHEVIENYCKYGEESDIPELHNFKFLQKMYGFEVIENEVPVILFDGEEPIAAGRLDMVIKMNDEVGGADLKRVASLDKEYLAYQLNLYRIAFRQCYDIEWKFLRGIHLKEDKRKFVEIPIAEEMAWDLVRAFMEEKNK